MDKAFQPELINRRGSGSYKWDNDSDPEMLPMYVADMDFKAAPAIVAALQKRIDHGVFGYTQVGKEYYDAIIRWFDRRHQWKIDRDWILYTSGVVPAVSAIIKAFTHAGDGVILQTPAYNCFFSSIRNNGCTLVPNPLVYQDGKWNIDYQDLEQKAADPRNKLLLLCNPHNPSGRVWSCDELQQLGTICSQHGVIVVSDEIHCELTMPGHHFTPYHTLPQALRETAIICNSPTKSFNLAGLQIANIITQREDYRWAIERAINDNEVCDVNPFGPIALCAAYTESESWLDGLKQYLHCNYQLLRQSIHDALADRIKVMNLEATYLPCIDTSNFSTSSSEIAEHLKSQYHVWLNPAEMYGGRQFLRVNIACHRSTLEEGIRRITAGLRIHL